MLANYFALPYYTALVHLDISYNEIGDRSALRLASTLNALSVETKVPISLNLAYNQLSNSLAGVVRANTNFSALHLSYNRLETDMAADMAQALESSECLTHLSLRSCNLDEANSTKM